MEKESTVYEISLLFLPTLSQEEALARAEHIRSDIAKRGGQVISHEDPISIPLAYKMVKVIGTSHQKFDKGYFAWIKFEMSPETLSDLKKHLDEDGSVLRYLIIKTVRENTLLHGHMMFRKEEKAAKEPTDEAATESKDESLEDLDKSIDDLVIA